jgi:hypothetical protein
MSLTSYTLLLLIIAVSNAVLGFGGAMLLGFGPRLPELKLQLTWRTWPSAALAFFAQLGRHFRRRNSSLSPAVPPVADETLPSLTLTPIQFADHSASPVTPVRSSPALAEVPGETLSFDDALAQLAQDVSAVRDELGELDARVRSCSESPTVDRVEECVADLKQTGHRLYEQQTLAIAAVQETRADGYIAGAATSDAHEFIEQHAEQLRQSLEQIDEWKVDPDNLTDDCRRLLAATEQLMQTCDEVGQALEEASTAHEPIDPARPKATVTEPHAISHESIHGVARVGRA